MMVNAHGAARRRRGGGNGAHQAPGGAFVDGAAQRVPSMYEAERGLFDLRQGRPLYVTAADARPAARGALLAAVEGLARPTVQQLGRIAGGAVRLAVTPHRARAMGLSSGRAPVSLRLNGVSSPGEIVRMATAPGAWAAQVRDVREASAPEAAGLALVRLGRLIPAVVGAPVGSDGTPELLQEIERGAILAATTAQIDAMARNTRLDLTHVSDGPVPLEGAADASFACFREANGLLEHVAILVGDRQRWSDPVPVRIHSACLTGDLFGSLRCDCGEQLRGSLRAFAAAGGGALLYLAQEGRGIGLGNKLRAYALQQLGLDTVDADCMLGFGADERSYEAAAGMLRHLQVERIRLFTNNPEKVQAMQDAGIRVVAREPLFGTLNRHNRRYFRAKAERAGHWLGEMLAGDADARK